MNMRNKLAATALASVLAACGAPSVIDQAKDAYLPECPGQSLGKIVNGYFITGLDSKTNWTAYRTEDENIVRVTAEGKILYVGVSTNAELDFLYNPARDELALQGVTFNGEEQVRGFATSLISNMCDKAKGL